jgi:hypothetical protein
MRAIIILALVALLMGLAGWLTIGRSPDKTSINIETEEIQQDTENAVENAEEMIESGARAITDDTNRIDEDRDGDVEVERSVPVDVDEEPVTTAPTETPVTSPVRP